MPEKLLLVHSGVYCTLSSLFPFIMCLNMTEGSGTLGQIISLCLKERSQHSDESGKHTRVWWTQSKTHFLKQQHSTMMQTDRMTTVKTAASPSKGTGALFTPEVEGKKKIAFLGAWLRRQQAGIIHLPM